MKVFTIKTNKYLRSLPTHAHTHKRIDTYLCACIYYEPITSTSCETCYRVLTKFLLHSTSSLSDYLNDLVTASYTYFICVGKVFPRTDLRYLVLVHTRMLLFPWLINLTRIINDLPEFARGQWQSAVCFVYGLNQSHLSQLCRLSSECLNPFHSYFYSHTNPSSHFRG